MGLRRVVLVVIWSVLQGYAQVPSERLTLEAQIATEKYCEVDEQGSALRLTFKAVLSNRGSDAVKVSPPFYPLVLVSRTVEDLRRRKYEFKLYAPDVLVHQESSVKSNSETELKPGAVYESETREVTLPVPLSSHYSKLESISPGTHYLQIVIQASAEDKSTFMLVKSQPIKVMVEQAPALQQCR